MLSRFRTHVAARRRAIRGFSLVELLIASAAALVVMAAIGALFSTFGGAARSTATIVSMTNGMRTVVERLREDLDGVTADLSRVGSPDLGMGYFEYIEGPRRDFHAAYSLATPAADTDDVLLFTTRAQGRPFSGRFTTVVGGALTTSALESPYAEVAWFCKEAPSAEQTAKGLRLHRLYRRQLLVAAYVGQTPFTTAGAANSLSNVGLAPDLPTLYANFDLSLRRTGPSSYAPNSLGDLARREVRFLREPLFPYVFSGGNSAGATFDETRREGEDVMLGNVIGFDVRVWDSEAELKREPTSGVVLQPGDPGYLASFTTVATGAYVDLGWGATVTVAGSDPETMIVSANRVPLNNATAFPPPNQTAFQSDGVAVTGTNAPLRLLESTYDSWSTHYEYDGIDQDNDGIIDEGTNGFDDNGDGVPDDANEAETSPPYPVPLRGIEVRIRCYEPTSKQIRQITVRHSFVRK